MSMKKFIYWRKDIPKKNGQTFADVHLLVGHNLGTIADFRQMAKELRKTFPQAKDGQIHCGSVQTSTRFKGFSIITWNACIPDGDYSEWNQPEYPQPEYYW